MGVRFGLSVSGSEDQFLGQYFWKEWEIWRLSTLVIFIWLVEELKRVVIGKATAITPISKKRKEKQNVYFCGRGMALSLPCFRHGLRVALSDYCL